MTATQPRDLEERLAPLAADLADALADRDKATARADEIKTEIRALLGQLGPGDYTAGLHTIKATVARTINTDRVSRDYPATAHPYLYDLKPDVKKVRAHLNEQQLEDYLDVSDLRVGLGKAGGAR